MLPATYLWCKSLETQGGERAAEETTPRGGVALSLETVAWGDRNYMNVTQIFH